MSINQVAQPVADTKRDLPQKERIDLTKNKRWSIDPSDLDVKNKLKYPPSLTNMSVATVNLIL